jgi:hypothetical protein
VHKKKKNPDGGPNSVFWLLQNKNNIKIQWNARSFAGAVSVRGCVVESG